MRRRIIGTASSTIPCRREGRQRTFRRQNDGIESQLLESLLADLGGAVVGPEASVKQALAMTDAEAQPVQKKPTIQVSSRFIRQIRANGSQSKRAAWQKTKTLRRRPVRAARPTSMSRKRDRTRNQTHT